VSAPAGAPGSAAAVRADLLGRWGDRAAATRASLALRVVFVGAESTGTTTVSRAVASRLGAPWVPEHLRDHCAARLADARAGAAAAGLPAPGMEDLVWTTGDFVAIATHQNDLEDAAAASSPVVVCDTDAFAVAIWHERYVGSRSAAVEALGDARDHPLYLLTSLAGVPFEQDGLRDGEHLRPWMTARFLEALAATGRRWVVLDGSADARVAAALVAIAEARRTHAGRRSAENLPAEPLPAEPELGEPLPPPDAPAGDPPP
jgi:HTH-type transcriptional regulator, transcriptional repressor of NAD biosynthesis genes